MGCNIGQRGHLMLRTDGRTPCTVGVESFCPHKEATSCGEEICGYRVDGVFERFLSHLGTSLDRADDSAEEAVESLCGHIRTGKIHDS